MVPQGRNTLNHNQDEDITQVLEVLQEWNDYLERNVPHFSQPQSQSLKQTQKPSQQQHSRDISKPRGLER